MFHPQFQYMAYFGLSFCNRYVTYITAMVLVLKPFNGSSNTFIEIENTKLTLASSLAFSIENKNSCFCPFGGIEMHVAYECLRTYFNFIVQIFMVECRKDR